MTREEMLKISWKPYMELLWRHPSGVEYEVLLVGIDFDDEFLTVFPFEKAYRQQNYVVNLSQISLLKRPRLNVNKQKRETRIIVDFDKSSPQHIDNSIIRE